jgi:hypothetical protein
LPASAGNRRRSVARFNPSMRSTPGPWGPERSAQVIAGLWLALFVCGCTEDLQFRVPRLIRRGRTADELVIYDAEKHRVMVADRKFQRRIVFTCPLFDNLWGMDADGNTIVLANQRILGLSHTPEEKRQLAVAELLFFSYDGRMTRQLSWERETGPVVDPRSVTLLSDGSVLVGDIRSNRIVHLDAQGKPLKFTAHYGFGPGELFSPSEVGVTAEGDLLVVDAYNSRIQLFSPDGAFKRVAVQKGKAPGFLDLPQFASRAPDGGWFITELSARRVSAFDRNLKFKRTMKPQLPDRVLAQLFGVAVLPEPTEVFVADALNSCIHVFSEDGRWLRAEKGLEP